MISMGQCAARASATAVFPTAVGPTSTGTSAPPKTPLQLPAWQLHDGGAAVDVVRRQLGGGEAQEHLPHLALAQALAGLHRCPTGVGRGEPLEPIGPAAEPSA